MWFTQSCSDFNFVLIYAIFPPNPNSQIFKIWQKKLLITTLVPIALTALSSEHQALIRRSACLAFHWDKAWWTCEGKDFTDPGSWSKTTSARGEPMSHKNTYFVPAWPAHGPAPTEGNKTKHSPVVSQPSSGQHLSYFFWLVPLCFSW